MFNVEHGSGWHYHWQLCPGELGIWLRPLMKCRDEDLPKLAFCSNVGEAGSQCWQLQDDNLQDALPNQLQEPSSYHMLGVTALLGTCVVDQKAACRASVPGCRTVLSGHHRGLLPCPTGLSARYLETATPNLSE